MDQHISMHALIIQNSSSQKKLVIANLVCARHVSPAASKRHFRPKILAGYLENLNQIEDPTQTFPGDRRKPPVTGLPLPKKKSPFRAANGNLIDKWPSRSGRKEERQKPSGRPFDRSMHARPVSGLIVPNRLRRIRPLPRPHFPSRLQRLRNRTRRPRPRRDCG